MPRALDAVELPRCAALSVDASGRAVRADPARAKVTTRGIEAMPARGMIPKAAEFERGTGVVGPTRARIDPDTSEQGDGEERTAVEIMNQDLVVAASL